MSTWSHPWVNIETNFTATNALDHILCYSVDLLLGFHVR